MKFCSEELWESLARADDTATFFQTPAWHRIAARHFKAESAPLLFDFAESQGGPACLPLLRDKRWGRWRYFSPFGTYTAVVCPRTLGPDEISVIESTLNPLNIQLASSPFTRNPVRVGKAIPARVQVLDLTTVDPDDVIKNWEKGQRRWSRVAQREGLSVRLASSKEDWDAYHRLYELSLARWGSRATTRYPASVFEDIRNLSGGETDRTLWIAEKDGVIGAGVLAFRLHRHMPVWHSAADAAFFEMGATQLLYLNMIGDAKREGFASLDFLGSAGLEGVETFKTHFGTKPKSYESFLNRSGIIGRLAGLRDALRTAGSFPNRAP
jgi:CelD/BcsL family acetyltransferase involved in cellulose biosynthesis